MRNIITCCDLSLFFLHLNSTLLSSGEGRGGRSCVSMGKRRGVSRAYIPFSSAGGVRSVPFRPKQSQTRRDEGVCVPGMSGAFGA